MEYSAVFTDYYGFPITRTFSYKLELQESILQNIIINEIQNYGSKRKYRIESIRRITEN